MISVVVSVSSRVKYPPVIAASVKAFVVVVSPMFNVPAVTRPSSVTVRGAVRALFKFKISPATLMVFGETPPDQFTPTLVLPAASVHKNVAPCSGWATCQKDIKRSIVEAIRRRWP